jgi:tartrate-resistant acid phosphatase type 5
MSAKQHFASLASACVIALLGACTSADAPRDSAPAPTAAMLLEPVTFLAFGDSGYHYDYLEPEDYATIVTQQQFLAKERTDWIEDKRPIEELAYPPTYRLPSNGSIVAASGLQVVADAMRETCVQLGCDFAAMLGDNIYPDGATGGRDERDAQRFQDLFVEPFAALGAGRPSFRIYAVLGNHDWRTSREGAFAQVKFLESTPPFYMDGLLYHAKPLPKRDDVEIFAIDTEVLLASTAVRKAVLADDASEVVEERFEKPNTWIKPASDAERNMVGWLESALKSSNARWKIVIGHHPLWSTSGSKFEQARALRRLILPTLCRYADLYVAGHEHTLEVHTDDCSEALPGEHLDPLVHVVSGSAAKMRPINSAFIRNQQRNNRQLRTLYAKGLVWGFAHLTFEQDRARIKILETTSDGSARTNVSFEDSFVRRHSRGRD